MPPPIGLYVHIPFCKARCHYCDFATGTGTSAEADRYLDLLESEAVREAPGRQVETVFVGGGTPSVLDEVQLSRLFQDIVGRFELLPGGEISIECNPESLSESKALLLSGLGVNRVSLGVQSFDEQELSRLGRLHDVRAVERAVAALGEARIANFNLDLICGFPGNTPEKLQHTLLRLAALAPPHVSVYIFQLEAGSRWGRTGVEPPDEDLQVDLYYQAKDFLETAGYGHYEISNFARPGRECRHNLKYWLSEPYLGIGLSAASYEGGVRRVNPDAMAAYGHAVEAGAAVEEALGEAGRAREELVMRLRLLRGTGPLEARLGSLPGVRDSLERFAGLGLLEFSGGGYALSRKGLTLSNEVFADLI